MNPGATHCSRCGGGLDSAAPHGLCRGCLLLSALDESPDDAWVAGSVGEGVPEQIRVLGDYELVSEVARGGMGVVYRARQRSLDREVAVKVLLFGQFAGSAAEARFRAEALAAARLRHPNVVAVHEVGQVDGQWFLAMELVRGTDLSKRVGKGLLTSREAAALGQLVAEALEHAHGKGVLHRDLKPSNILIDELGHPRVTDFGLAKLLDGAESTTLSGQVLGSPGYLAPEQAGLVDGARKVGPEADVYGLGGTLYFAVTGRPPFCGEGVAATLELVRTTDPLAPRVLNPAVHRDLETIVMRCLQREPGRRYRTAGELAADLGRFLRGEPIQARPVAGWERAWLWARRKPVAASALGLGLLLAVGGPTAAWQMNRMRLQAEALAGESRERLAALQATTGLGLAESGAGLEALPWLVDALRIAGADGQAAAIHRLRLGILGARLPRLEALWQMNGRVKEAWLADGGKTLITWHSLEDQSGPSLWAWSVETGRPVELNRPPGRAGVALAVSRDRSAILVPEDGGLRLRRRQGTNVVSMAIPMDARPTTAAFSWDARRVVIGTDAGGVRVLSVDGAEAAVGQWSFTNAVERVEFSPAGGRVLVRLGGAYARVIDLATGRVTRNAGRNHPVTAAALSPDGNDVLVATSDGHADVWSLFRSTRRFEVVGDPGITAVAWAPMGGVVATASMGGRVRIWTVQGRRLVSPFLAHGAAVEHIVFLPDGRRILTIDATRIARVWLLPADWREAAREAADDDVAESARETLRPDRVPLEVEGTTGGVTWIGSVLEDGRVRTRTKSGVTLWTSAPFRAPVQGLAVVGSTIRVELAGGGSHEIEVKSELRPIEALIGWGEVLSARRLKADGDTRPLAVEQLIERWTEGASR